MPYYDISRWNDPVQVAELASLDAQGNVLSGREAIIPFELKGVEADRRLASGRHDASSREMPVYQAGYDQNRLRNRLSVEEAIAAAAAGLSGNQVSRLTLEDDARKTRRSLNEIPPELAANYRGSQYINPALSQGRIDANAQLGILDQRLSSLGLEDARVRQSEDHARQMSDSGNRMADATFAQQKANFDLRDRELSSQMSGLNTREQQIKLGNQEAAAQRAQLELQRQRALNSRGGGGGGMMVGQSQPQSGGNGSWGYGNTYNGGALMDNSAYPFFDTNQTYFNYG